MPTTPVYSLPYPGPDDAPAGAPQIQSLAEAVEAALAALIPNSGLLTNLALTPGAGWSLLVKEHQIIGKKMWVRIQMQRTGGNLVADGTGGSNPGNIVGDPVIATVDNASERPTMDCFGAFRGSLTSGSVQINSATGEVKISDAHTASTIATNDTVQVFFSYPIP